MKIKNFKSAIHNFAHSFMSIDYTKSGRLAVNVLIDLYNLNLEPKATFDFVNKSIWPTEAETTASKQLLNEYLDWLPEHFNRHNCDLGKLKKLEITVSADFANYRIPPGMSDTIQFVVSSSSKWEADGRDNQLIEIFQTELMKKAFLKSRIPEAI